MENQNREPRHDDSDQPLIREFVEGLCMSEQRTQDPKLFVQVLQQYHETDSNSRGDLANALSDVIITKRVDLAEVRQILLDTGANELMDELDRLIDLIQPYIEEGGVDE